MDVSSTQHEPPALPIDLAAYLEAAAGSLMVEKRFAPVSEEAVRLFLEENAAEIGSRAVVRMHAFVSKIARSPELAEAATRQVAAAVYAR